MKTRSVRHRALVLGLLMLAGLPGCVLPMDDGEDHWRDIGGAIAKNYRSAHRKWDRHFWDLDWDDPYIDWHDDSYATMPGWRAQR